MGVGFEDETVKLRVGNKERVNAKAPTQRRIGEGRFISGNLVV